MAWLPLLLSGRYGIVRFDGVTLHEISRELACLSRTTSGRAADVS